MEIQLSRLIDALPGLVWTAQPDGLADFVNQRWSDYTGLSVEQAAGYGWLDAIHPEDLNRIVETWRTFLDAAQPGEVEARLRRRDGEYRRTLFSAAPIRDETGRIVKWCGINTDIENRLRAEETTRDLERARADASLRASEDELRLALDRLTEAQRLSRTGSFTWDVLADEHTWSEELYRIFGFKADAKVKISMLQEVIHPDDLPAVEAVVAGALDSAAFDLVFRVRPHKGDLRHAHVVAHPIREIKDRPVFIGALQDVTESKLAEEALKASEAKLRRANEFLAAAQRLSRTGSFMADIEANEFNWSEELYRIFEIDPTTKPTVQLVRDRIHPEDRPSFDAEIGRAMGRRDSDLTYRLLTPRGDTKYLHTVGRVIEQATGRRVFVGAIQDVTERKLGEEALNKARAELTHVARITALSALTASIAHEVNQPLAGIITNASTCLRMLAADPPNLDGARATAQRTIRDGNRAAEVIQRLRGLFSRKQPGMEAVDLNDAAREVLVLSSGELQRRRAILRTDFAPNLPTARGDRVQLQQVILNLILNAADAMNDVGDRPRHLSIETGREYPDRVRLSVRDSGVGFDPQNAGKLFNAFYTTKTDGMGVGLSISRSIIESHEGRIWAAANDGPGATFSFSLPSSPAPASGVRDYDAHGAHS